jgi:hypothetical protein
MRAAILAVVVAGCWTGPTGFDASEVPVNHPHHPPFRVTMERTPCFGACPTYKVAIDGDGTVRVRAGGTVRVSHVSTARVRELERHLDEVGFFELDDQGHVPAETQCVQNGSTTTCTIKSISFCSDTSHAIITVKRGTRVHSVDDAHCSDDHVLLGIEQEIDTLAGMSSSDL